jgi:hypothetical protein
MNAEEIVEVIELFDIATVTTLYFLRFADRTRIPIGRVEHDLPHSLRPYCCSRCFPPPSLAMENHC